MGHLPRLSGTGDVAIAAVVVAAIEHSAAVTTSDSAGLPQLADAAGSPARLTEA